MTRWGALASQSPELAERGRSLLAESHGYSYLATVSPDGGPRLHPVAPILSDRGLFLAITRRSPKAEDLRADPRMALHACVRPPDDEEFVVRGLAHEVEGEAARRAAVAGAADGAQLTDAMALFEIEPREVRWAVWSEGRPVRRRWVPGEGGSRPERSRPTRGGP